MDHGDGDGGDAGAGEDGDGDASSHAKEEMGMKMGMISPFSGAPGQQDLSPPRRVSRVSPPWRLRLVSGKLGCSFSGKTESSAKRPRGGGAVGPFGGPTRGQGIWPRGLPPFGPPGPPPLCLVPTAFLPKKN